MGKEITKYVDAAMFEAEDLPYGMPTVTLLNATPDPLGSLAAACMMYEGRVIRDLDEITDDERRHYFAESFRTHLKAPWEFVDLHFMIEGVTRAFTHQMVRQRTAVFAQESMRFAVKHKIAARPGPLTASQKDTSELWDVAVEKVWEVYNALIGAGVPAEEARGLLPHDTLTRLHYKTNLRNLADHLGNRLCTQAQFEWKLVAADLFKAVSGYRGQVMEYGVDSERGLSEETDAWQWREIATSPIFRPVCFAAGKCPFQAGFDRGCTIRERVEAGRFDEIDDAEWMLDPKAGFVK